MGAATSYPAPETFNPNPGPMSVLLHSPVAIDSPIAVVLELVGAVIFPDGLSYEPETPRSLDGLRALWAKTPAEYRSEWQDFWDRDLNLALSILDDPSRVAFFRGMHKRILLRCLVLELGHIFLNQRSGPVLRFSPEELASWPPPPTDIKSNKDTVSSSG